MHYTSSWRLGEESDKGNDCGNWKLHGFWFLLRDIFRLERVLQDFWFEENSLSWPESIRFLRINIIAVVKPFAHSLVWVSIDTSVHFLLWLSTRPPVGATRRRGDDHGWEGVYSPWPTAHIRMEECHTNQPVFHRPKCGFQQPMRDSDSKPTFRSPSRSIPMLLYTSIQSMAYHIS